jgi:hypothetical protein
MLVGYQRSAIQRSRSAVLPLWVKQTGIRQGWKGKLVQDWTYDWFGLLGWSKLASPPRTSWSILYPILELLGRVRLRGW